MCSGATSGRTSPAAWSPSPDRSARPREYYFGTTGGGVWKTTDGGTTLLPVTDKYFGGSVGALAVSESNPDIVFAGGGETQIRGNVSYGDGVWKTTDGGKTWTSMGLKETQYISRIRIHPTNPDIVYVGALGHAFGAGPDRGVYKTVDGGKTWKKILFRNDSTGIADLIMEPGNPNVLYATFWQAYRAPWTFSSGGPGSGIFKTTDGGDHWTEITHNQGLPTGLLGRMGIAISPAKPTRVWALIENEPAGGVYRSDDAGATWKFLSGNRNLRQRAWYYSNIYADPKDTNVVAAPQVGAEWSKDGGMTWSGGFGAGDNHDVYWAADDPKRIVMGARQRRRDHDRRRHDAAERRRADGTVLPRPPHERTSRITSADRSRTRARPAGRCARRVVAAAAVAVEVAAAAVRRRRRTRSSMAWRAARADTSPRTRSIRTSSTAATTAASSRCSTAAPG